VGVPGAAEIDAGGARTRPLAAWTCGGFLSRRRADVRTLRVPVDGDGSAEGGARTERHQMNKPIPTETETAAPPEGAPAAGPARHGGPDFPALLDRMTRVERLRAYRSGTFDRREVATWSARYPEEAPLLNGELEWIARDLADLD
jgi:hypothetical protein